MIFDATASSKQSAKRPDLAFFRAQADLHILCAIWFHDLYDIRPDNARTSLGSALANVSIRFVLVAPYLRYLVMNPRTRPCDVSPKQAALQGDSLAMWIHK